MRRLNRAGVAAVGGLAFALGLAFVPSPAVAVAPESGFAASPTGVVVPMPIPRSCSVDDATLTWGFKESFRSYISGTIANGEWTVFDGASYETPEFEFPHGTGAFGEAESRVSFAGAIRFTGHGGILDTTVSNPVLEWGGGVGTLYLDVSGTTQEGEPVDESAVAFASLTFDGGVGTGRNLRFADVTATLTDAGAAAFGTYEPGEPLDPLRIELDVEADCALLDVTAPVPAWPIWIAAGIGAAIIAVATVLVVRRRRASADPPAS